LSLSHDVIGVDGEPWREGHTAYFRTTSNGLPVIDMGRLTFTS
jgi:hypothetical protein